MVAVSETERESHDGEFRAHATHKPKRRILADRSICESGASRRHYHSRGTCREAEGARILGLRKDPWALPESDSMPAAWPLRSIQLDGRGNMADRTCTAGNSSGKTESADSPESGIPGPVKIGLKQTATFRPSQGRAAHPTCRGLSGATARPHGVCAVANPMRN
jgi:hypothetical protein